MIGSSAMMQEVRFHLGRAAASTCTVLITGETGTGKELAAEFIHNNSPRRDKPFVRINSAAIPDGLLESELFGHTKGAFTGADDLREGLLAAANGGTVFLDEIGDMSALAQAKILCVIDRREICRLGGTRSMQLDIRFVAATNQNLEQMAIQGSFRQDLFFRLNVARIHLPPLRDRQNDIPLLVRHYCREFMNGGSAPEFSEECLRYLEHYTWPGNIRELKNLLEVLLLDQSLQQFRVEHLPEHLRRFVEAIGGSSQRERELLLAALFSAKWNKSKAAAQLHWSRRTLYRKIARYKISIAL